jgi:hypothetical protein
MSVFDFFKRLGEHLGINVDWGEHDWWMPIDIATAKVNSVRCIDGGSNEFRPLLVHSLFEVYIRDNIEHIATAEDFDVYVKKFLDSVSEFVDGVCNEENT